MNANSFSRANSRYWIDYLRFAATCHPVRQALPGHSLQEASASAGIVFFNRRYMNR